MYLYSTTTVQLSYITDLQVCLVDISSRGKEVAEDLRLQYPPSQVDFYHCDVMNYDLFKGVPLTRVTYYVV